MFASNIDIETSYLFDIHQHPIIPWYLYLITNLSTNAGLFITKGSYAER